MSNFSSSIFHTLFLSLVNVYSDVIFNRDATLTVIYLRSNTSVVTGPAVCILKWNRMLYASPKMQLSLSEALSFPKSCFSSSCFTKEDHCSYWEQTCIASLSTQQACTRNLNCLITSSWPRCLLITWASLWPLVNLDMWGRKGGVYSPHRRNTDHVFKCTDLVAYFWNVYPT